MNTSIKHIFKLIGALVCTIILFAFPVCSLAAETIESAQVPSSASASTPNNSEISEDPNYSEGSSGHSSSSGIIVYAAGSSVSGGCSITKLSSSSVRISGYSVTSPTDPGLKVTLQLQAYYDGGWHTLKTSTKSVSGTRVDLSKTYDVTSGYYYRVLATHALADGTSSASQTNSVLVG